MILLIILAKVVGKTTIPATASFTSNGLQKGKDQVVDYCRDWNLECIVNETKILIFKKEGKMKKNERWSMYDQII
jgi:hypothetical protein